MKKQIEYSKFEEFLVIRQGKFYIETFYQQDMINIETINLPYKEWPESIRFRLRHLREDERQDIIASDFYKIPGEKTRHPALHYFLNKWLDERLVLDAKEFNSISKSEKLLRPLLIS